MLPPPTHHLGGDPAFFLDVDGTLLDIAASPDRVHVPGRVVRLLAGLQQRAVGALALVSGRAVADLDRLLHPLVLPCAGLHGAERRDAAGRFHGRRADEALGAVRRGLADWVAAHPGTLLEDKGAALALHYRQAPAAEAAARDAMAEALARLGPRFALLEGKCVLELKPAGASKAHAIRAFMAEAPFAGRRPVFAGDDVTDEDGFRAVNDLGGLSVLVGQRSGTAARSAVDGVPGAIGWLEGFVTVGASA